MLSGDLSVLLGAADYTIKRIIVMTVIFNIIFVLSLLRINKYNANILTQTLKSYFLSLKKNSVPKILVIDNLPFKMKEKGTQTC